MPNFKKPSSFADMFAKKSPFSLVSLGLINMADQSRKRDKDVTDIDTDVDIDASKKTKIKDKSKKRIKAGKGATVKSDDEKTYDV